MMKKTYEIKAVSRNRRTDEEIINVSSEFMARAVYGDQLIDAAIARKKIENNLLEKENATR